MKLNNSLQQMSRFITLLSIALSIFGISACSSGNDSEDLLELQSVSGCISDAESLFSYENGAAIVSKNEQKEFVLEFPAMWYPRESVKELEYEFSQDTLYVHLYKKMQVTPGTNCVVMVKAKINGDLNVKYISVNAMPYELQYYNGLKI